MVRIGIAARAEAIVLFRPGVFRAAFNTPKFRPKAVTVTSNLRGARPSLLGDGNPPRLTVRLPTEMLWVGADTLAPPWPIEGYFVGLRIPDPLEVRPKKETCTAFHGHVAGSYIKPFPCLRTYPQ